MSKFLVVYERESWFWGAFNRSFVGFEIVEAERFEAAYHAAQERLKDLRERHKNMLRLHIQTLEQVNDDFKLSDVHITSLAEIEEYNRHRETMAKAKGEVKKNKS